MEVIMKKIIGCLLLILGLLGCHEVKVGYLETENANYNPNVLEVRKTLDPVIDADRIDKKYNWISYPIDGIVGTQPMYMSIASVKEENGGDVQKFLEEVKVRGNGTFDVPFDNQIPEGKYIITLKVENEGYSALLPDIFTIWVY